MTYPKTEGLESMAFDQIKYNNEYNKSNYDTIRALVPKGRGKEIKDFAKANGESVSVMVLIYPKKTEGFCPQKSGTH